GAEGDPRQRGGSGADLGSPDPSLLPSRGGQGVREIDPHGPRGAAGGGRPLLRLPRVGGRLLHDRPGSASERRRFHIELTTKQGKRSAPCRRITARPSRTTNGTKSCASRG